LAFPKWRISYIEWKKMLAILTTIPTNPSHNAVTITVGRLQIVSGSKDVPGTAEFYE